MNGTAMVMALTTFELKKLDAIQRACPNVDVQMVSMEVYILIGYKGETDEQLIRVENESMAQAERQFGRAYQKLDAAGWMSATGVRRMA